MESCRWINEGVWIKGAHGFAREKVEEGRQKEGKGEKGRGGG